MSFVGLRYSLVFSCFRLVLFQIFICGGKGVVFRFFIIFLIRFFQSVGEGFSCVWGVWSVNRSRRRCRMGRLFMFVLVRRVLSFFGFLWRFEVFEMGFCFLCIAVTVYIQDERGGYRKNFYLIWNFYRKLQIYLLFFSILDQ